MRRQRIIGAALVVIAVLALLLASTGETPEERDATAALLLGPLGLYMMFAKTCVLYGGEPEAGPAQDNMPKRKGDVKWQENE